MESVSVIVPVHNTQSYITECIKSLTEQTYKNLEIILIDDGSDYECQKLLNELTKQDNRIKLYRSEENRGVGVARNLGLRKATGDYVYFVDSDDYVPPKTIELLVKHIGSNPVIRGKIKNTYFSKSFAVIFEGLFKPKYYTEKRYNLIKNNSVVNFLFTKDFIKENRLVFSEQVEVFADLEFLIPALNAVEQVPFLKEALYFKRKRNDPISNPSLSQLDTTLKINDFLHVYNRLRDKYNTQALEEEFLDRQFLNFYRKDIVKLFEDNNMIDCYYDDLSELSRKVNNNLIKEYDWPLRKEIRHLVNGDITRYKKVNNRHQFLRDFRQGLKTKRKFYRFLYKRCFMKMPIKENFIFLESFLGKNYSDSPKYIYEYMIKNNMDYKFVWSFREPIDIPGKHIQVKRFSLRYFYYLARSKYWISNSRLPKYLLKRKGNIYLQTWHGTPLKKLVFDMDDVFSADPKYKKNFYEQSRRWDFLSSPNKYSTQIFRSAFKYNKEFLEYGYPRNDILYQKNTKEKIISLKKEMGIPLDKKVILYAPTWRDDEYYSRGKYKFTLKLDLENLQKHLGTDYIILLRMHYFIASELDISDFQGFAYNFSSYNDIAELYLVSDILITDYSSVFFDYANLRRPILFFTYDLEKYRNQLRGFYIDMEKEVPGPLLMNNQEVLNAILNINKVNEEYRERYEQFYNRFCLWDDGNATKRTVERVFNKK